MTMLATRIRENKALYVAAGPLDKVRARVEEVAERGDGVFLTPPTYFIAPDELAEYQRRIVDAFAPA